jgi:hypothetical protein
VRCDSQSLIAWPRVFALDFEWNSWIIPGVLDRIGTVVLSAGFSSRVVVFVNHVG